MKKLFVLILAMACLLMFSGCCFHSEWSDATCTAPKTCVECGETEGEALGHTWVDATCAEPKTCQTCQLTEGEALGHSWVDATTEAPKTCTTCSETEGERIITDARFTTASTIDLQGKWAGEIIATGDMMGIEGFESTITMEMVMDFGDDGTLEMGCAVANEEEFIDALVTYVADTLYAEMAAQGYDKETADAAMVAAYGMTVEEFAAAAAAEVDVSAMVEAMSFSLVYYVDGNQLYAGMDWDMELEPVAFTLEGDTLTLAEDLSGMGAESMAFTRVTE